MIASTWRDRLLELRDAHAAVADGGESLLAAILEIAPPEGAPERRQLVVSLAGLAWDPDGRMRGVALDALVAMKAADACDSLLSVLDDDAIPDELRDDIAKALLRLRCESAVPACVRRITTGGSRTSLPAVLAALAPLDPGAFRYLASDFVVDFYRSGVADRMPSWLPTFMYHISDGPTELLSQHLSDVGSRDSEAGEWYRQRIGAYLERPWSREELGPARHEAAGLQLAKRH